METVWVQSFCSSFDYYRNCLDKLLQVYYHFKTIIPVNMFATRLVLIVTNAKDGSSIHADCFYYYQESNAIYLDPYNLQCLTPQGL